MIDKSRNASQEFIKERKGELPAEPIGAAAGRDGSVGAAFEFVKRLAQELSAGTFELPPFPDVALRVRDALNDPDVSVDKVSRIVLSEPVLSARLLRVANSAMVRRGSTEIIDVKVAIGRLGFDMVRNAAVSLAMDSTFSAPAGGVLREYIERTRRHSVQVGALSYMLARRHANGIGPDEAMLAGLLHDIGRFYILTRVDDFPDLFNHPDVLEGLLQDWHTGVGRAIVESWNFPESIAVAVDEHEVLDREHTGKADMADVVLVANLLANRDDARHPEPPAMSGIPACAKLRIDELSGATVLAESEEEIRSMSQALGG